MRIAANAAIFPSHLVTNDDICEKIRANTSGLSRSDLSAAITGVDRYLHELGARHRFWLSGSEKPIDLIKQAYETALERALIEPTTIDSLIYCAVDRPLLEPANAALLSAELGLTRVRAFDVGHACTGWFTALQIAGDRADKHDETSVILSAEFPMTSGGVAYPRNFDLSDPQQTKWKLATFVLGEAVSVTIVAPGGSPLKYQQRNNNNGYQASYVRLPQAERFLSRPGSTFVAPELTFYSNPFALIRHGSNIGFEAFEALGLSDTDEIVVIPHTISSKVVEVLRERYSRRFTILDIFPEVGNIGTSSLAAGLSRCERPRTTDRIPTGARRVGWMLGAGMSAVAFEFP